MKDDKISIIIPAYNSQDFIKRCIDSVISQTYSNYEIIVVNDGSTDKTEEILKDLKEKNYLANMKIITVPNGGVGKARNIGIKEASGSYIFFIDSDDYLEKECLEILYKNIKDEDLDILCGNFFIVKKDESKLKNYMIKPGEYTNITENFIYEYFFENIGSSIWGKLYRASCIKNERFNKTKMGEDVFFNIRTIINNKNIKIGIIDYPIYNYYENTNSVSYRKIENLVDNWQIEIDTILKSNSPIKEYLIGMQLYRLYNEYVHNASLGTNKKEYINEFTIQLLQNNNIVKFAQESIKNKTYTMIKNRKKRIIYKATTVFISKKQVKLLRLITHLKIKFFKNRRKN